MKKNAEQLRLESLESEVRQFMEKLAGVISAEELSPQYHLYGVRTHKYLLEQINSKNGLSFSQIYLPLAKKYWSQEFLDLRYTFWRTESWYTYTFFRYYGSISVPNLIPACRLFFGYAFLDGRLLCRAFFVTLKIVERVVDNQKIIFSEYFVVDPIAELQGIKPDCYLGVPIERDLLFSWFHNVCKAWEINPLEIFLDEFLKKTEAEQNNFQNRTFYENQLSDAPLYFPKKLQEFAKENNLFIPEGQMIVI